MYEYPYPVGDNWTLNLMFSISEMILIGFVVLVALWGALLAYGATK